MPKRLLNKPSPNTIWDVVELSDATESRCSAKSGFSRRQPSLVEEAHSSLSAFLSVDDDLFLSRKSSSAAYVLPLTYVGRKSCV